MSHVTFVCIGSVLLSMSDFSCVFVGSSSTCINESRHKCVCVNRSIFSGVYINESFFNVRMGMFALPSTSHVICSCTMTRHVLLWISHICTVAFRVHFINSSCHSHMCVGNLRAPVNESFFVCIGSSRASHDLYKRTGMDCVVNDDVLFGAVSMRLGHVIYECVYMYIYIYL